MDVFAQLGVKDAQRLAGIAMVAKSSGWWWPMRGAVILTERPTVLHRDQLGRLHRADGPALAYPDGWGIHAWHGVRVPADLIEHGWTAERALKERNQEVRRAAIEHRGWDAFIREARLALVGKPVRDPGNPSQQIALYDCPHALYDEPVRVVLVTNATVERDGTRRKYGLTVPASISDPIDAIAWTFDVQPATYRALQRAT